MDNFKNLTEISQLPASTQQIALGAFLAKLFQEKSVGLIIVGGAAVQFYTQADYVTKDLDAILQGDTTALVDEVMNSIGFKRTTTYRHFEHPFFNFVVEFPPSPVEVGNRHIDILSQIKTDEGVVRVIRVEDLIMDRIIAGIEWKSPGHIAQAKLLWIKNRKFIDKAYLRQFAKEEGYETELKKILATPIIGTKAPQKIRSKKK